MDIVITIIVVIGNILFAYLALKKDHKSATHISFTVLNVCNSIMAILHLMTLYTDNYTTSLWLVRSVIALAAIQIFLYLFFVSVFPNSKFRNNKKIVIVSLITVLTVLLALSPYVFTGIKLTGYRQPPIPEAGYGAIVFVLFILFLISYSIKILRKKYQESSGQRRVQLSFIIIGSIIMFALFLFLNLLATILFKNTSLTIYTPVYIFIFLLFAAYATLRYKLLDIKIFFKRTAIITGTYVLFVCIIGVFVVAITEYANYKILSIAIFSGLLFLLPYAKSKIETWIKMLFPVKIVDVSTFFDRTIYKIKTESIEEFIEKLQKFITENFHIQSHVFLKDQEKKNWYALECGRKNKVKAETSLEKSTKISKMLIDESEVGIVHSESNSLFVPMKYEDEIIGCITLEGTQEKDLSNEQAEMLCELGRGSAKVIYDLRVLERAKTGARILANRLQ